MLPPLTKQSVIRLSIIGLGVLLLLISLFWPRHKVSPPRNTTPEPSSSLSASLLAPLPKQSGVLAAGKVGSEIYYFDIQAIDGVSWKALNPKKGTVRAVQTAPSEIPDTVTWSPNGQFALLTTTNPGNTTKETSRFYQPSAAANQKLFFILNLTTNQLFPLPVSTNGAGWRSNNTLLLISTATDTNLNLKQPDDSPPTPLALPLNHHFVIDLLPSPASQNLVAIETDDNRWQLADLDKNTLSPLPADITQLTWQIDGQSLITWSDSRQLLSSFPKSAGQPTFHLDGSLLQFWSLPNQNILTKEDRGTIIFRLINVPAKKAAELPLTSPGDLQTVIPWDAHTAYLLHGTELTPITLPTP